jgi:hypothetical protein
MPETIPLVSGLVELALSFVLGILVAFGAFRLFARLTKDLDEVDEIRKNNVAVAIVLAGLPGEGAGPPRGHHPAHRDAGDPPNAAGGRT